MLTTEQQQRYARNLMLKEIGINGQQKLLQSRVLVVGAGGLGSPVLLYLAAAGVGTLGIIDSDQVDLSNLQRQIVHDGQGLGKSKVESAARRLTAINPDVTIDTHNTRLTAEGGASLVASYDFVVEAADNFPTKFLVNDLCLKKRIPFSHGGILEFTGQTMTVIPGKSRCYRCVFEKEPPEDIGNACSRTGVLGAVAGIVGSIQAAETVKFLLGCGELLHDSLLVCDSLTMQFRRIPNRPRNNCLCRSLLVG